MSEQRMAHKNPCSEPACPQFMCEANRTRYGSTGIQAAEFEISRLTAALEKAKGEFARAEFHVSHRCAVKGCDRLVDVVLQADSFCLPHGRFAVGSEYDKSLRAKVEELTESFKKAEGERDAWLWKASSLDVEFMNRMIGAESEAKALLVHIKCCAARHDCGYCMDFIGSQESGAAKPHSVECFCTKCIESKPCPCMSGDTCGDCKQCRRFVCECARPSGEPR